MIIYSGPIPSATFVEHLIRGLAISFGLKKQKQKGMQLDATEYLYSIFLKTFG